MGLFEYELGFINKVVSLREKGYDVIVDVPFEILENSDIETSDITDLITDEDY